MVVIASIASCVARLLAVPQQPERQSMPALCACVQADGGRNFALTCRQGILPGVLFACRKPATLP
jgi:hypothetical protein